MFGFWNLDLSLGLWAILISSKYSLKWIKFSFLMFTRRLQVPLYICCVLISIWKCQSWWELLEVSYVLLEVINLEPSGLVLSPLFFCLLSFSKYEIYYLEYWSIVQNYCILKHISQVPKIYIYIYISCLTVLLFIYQNISQRLTSHFQSRLISNSSVYILHACLLFREK